MPDQELMTIAEIHDFGIEVVCKYIQEDGYELEEVNIDPLKHPQIVASKDGELIFITVRTACYPNKGDLEIGVNDHMMKYADKFQATAWFASVGICNANGKSEKEMGTPVKGAPYHVSYAGIVPIHTLPRRVIKYIGEDGQLLPVIRGSMEDEIQ